MTDTSEPFEQVPQATRCRPYRLVRPARLTALLLALTLSGCQGENGAEAPARPEGDDPGMNLTSTAFDPGQPIPRKHTGEGEDVSPPLNWSGVPDGTEELALIVDDPDAPTDRPWVHWVIYRIPADAGGLREGIPREKHLSTPPGARQGVNGWPAGGDAKGNIGYRGPMPPPGHGRHRYYFRLYALDAELDLAAEATKQEVLDAMEGHILAEAVVMGTYERN
jgi:hypothetical protein